MNIPDAHSEILELSEERTARIRAHHHQPLANLPVTIDLPYATIGGPGLERLCALLLIADGQVPRYFGKSGTADYGVDVVVSDGSSCAVYQCKNVSKYSKGNLSRWLTVFEKTWLANPALPIPSKYVLVCPLDLREKEDIEQSKMDFHRRKGVRVEIWQKATIDERLRRLPDIVADQFAPTVADFFCSLNPRWEDGFTTPVAASGRRARVVDRFLTLREEGRLASKAETVRERVELIQEEGLVAFIGSSGAGKSMAALELATAMAEKGWRPWHVDMRNAEPARMYESVERRAVRPSIFVLDDCHLATDEAQKLLDRIHTANLHNRVLIVLTVTTTAFAGGSLDQAAITQFIEENIDPQHRLILRPQINTYREIIATARPDLSSISVKTLGHLLAVTAGDLFLLDEVLRMNDADSGRLDAVTVESLQKKVMQRYFGERYPWVPSIKRIAAIAQFDVAVPKSAIETPPLEIQDRMLVSVGPPPSWLFSHVSLAELIFSALSIADSDKDRNRIAVDAIVETGLRELAPQERIQKLAQLMRARLKLVDDAPLKQALLRDPRILSMLQEPTLPLSVLSLASSLSVDIMHQSPFLGALRNRIEKMLSGANEIPAQDAPVLGAALRILGIVDGEQLESACRRANIDRLVRSLAARADLPATLRILQYITPELASRLIGALDSAALDAMVDRTINEERSVGTLDRALRGLGRRDTDQHQLATFEERLGAERMLRLVRARADLRSTLKIIQSVTRGFADQLIEAIEPTTLDELVERTITMNRSVGTIGIVLRDLGNRGHDQDKLAAFERRLGANRMVRLISNRADLPSTLKILQAVTPAFVDQLIEALDPCTLDALVERTIHMDRSIGTIDLALREIGKRSKDKRQLAALEDRLGVDRMLHLFRKRANLRSAMNISDSVTESYAERLIQALHPETLEVLIDNTINSSYRKIRHVVRSARFFAHLQEQLPSNSWRRLIIGCGGLQDLTIILAALQVEKRSALIVALSGVSRTDWEKVVERTNAFGVSIFCSDLEFLSNSAVRSSVENVAAVRMKDIVESSHWNELAVAYKALADQKKESITRSAFLKEFKAKVATVDLSSPPIFDDIKAAASFLTILWDERAQDRLLLSDSILSIVPKYSEWPLDHRRLTGARLLMAFAQAEEMPKASAERLFRMCAFIPPEFDISTCDSKVLFLYLYNIWAVIVARAPEGLRSLVKSQDKSFWDGLLEHIDKLATQSANPRKLNVLALVGLLDFSGVFPSETLRGRVRGAVRGFPYLLDSAEQLRGVTRFFVFRGLAMIGPPRLVSEPERLHRLLAAIESYEHQTPALNFIRESVTNALGG